EKISLARIRRSEFDFVICNFERRRAIANASRSQAQQEMISFIIPAYNEELELSSTIAAIRVAASDVTLPYEIIVVDDASTDMTAELAAQGGARVISINRRQIAASRNAGARAAQGDYLFFVDADTRINRTHIVEGITALEAG